jgi:hypothetical protein
MTSTNEFTMGKALEIQKMNLEQWATVLRPEIQFRLEHQAAKMNAMLRDCETGSENPYNVWRGQDMTDWVLTRASELAR